MYYFFDYWELRHKVTFDGPNHLIIVNDEVSEIDVETDIYSDWKEWSLYEQNMKYSQALRVVGGDATPTGALGATFFTINEWKIIVKYGSVNFTGNLYSDDYDSPVFTESGIQLATLTVSNLIDKISPDETNNATIFV